MNVEHLLDVLTSIDATSEEVWSTCCHFIEYLTWHKSRLVALGPKIRALPDDHPSNTKCLSRLACSFHAVGNYAEEIQLLIHTLKLWREQGDDCWVAETLWKISRANRSLYLYKEGIQQAKEALEIYERLDDVSGQARSLRLLASLLHYDGQLDAAEGAALQAIDRSSGKGEKYEACECYRILGSVYHSRGKTEEAINHFKAALRIASSSNWGEQLFWVHFELADLYFDKARFDDAHAHIEQAKPCLVDDAYCLSRAVQLQARVWYGQRKFKEARSAASEAAGVFERLGATNDVENCKTLLQTIEQAMNKHV